MPPYSMGGSVFGSILIFAVTLMQTYVFWRAASLPLITQRIARKRLFVIGLVLWVLFVSIRLTGSDDAGAFGTVLELLGMTWMASLFLVSVALLLVDFVTGFGFFLSRFTLRLRGLAFIAGAALSLFSLVQGLRPPVVQDYPVYLAGLPANLDGTVIVALSDLHLGAVLGEPWLAARVAQVQAQRPDAVVLLGDVFEGHAAPRQELLATLRQLSAPLGVWGVLGNHESYIVRSNSTALFENAGIHLLRNAAVELRPGLVLAGVDDLASSRHAPRAEGFLTAALAGRPAGATILLSHAPVAADLAAGKGVNLMLSGHTHGGQIWPFSYLVRQRFPLFEGMYKLGSMTLIVSRGTGTWGPRMRLWRPAEILRLTLHAGTQP